MEFPRGDDQDAAAMVLRQGETRFGCHVIIEKASGVAVGTIGFFGPPDDTGTVMIGFGLVKAVRGQGYATEARAAAQLLRAQRPGESALPGPVRYGLVLSHPATA